MALARVPTLRERGLLRTRVLLPVSVLASIIGFGSALLLYPAAVSILGVVFLAFALAPLAESLLDQNRVQIWEEGVAANTANRQLAMGLSAIFIGIFFAFFVGVMFTESHLIEVWFEWQLERLPAASVEEMTFGSFDHIIGRNTIVAIGAFIAAMIYRHGGMILVLAWNASTWGTVFSCVILMATEDQTNHLLVYSLKTLFCILPHLVVEAIAYILIAMSGVFLSRATTRYSWSSEAFAQVGAAVLNILMLAVVLLAIAGALEAFWAPRAIQFTFGL